MSACTGRNRARGTGAAPAQSARDGAAPAAAARSGAPRAACRRRPEPARLRPDGCSPRSAPGGFPGPSRGAGQTRPGAACHLGGYRISGCPIPRCARCACRVGQNDPHRRGPARPPGRGPPAWREWLRENARTWRRSGRINGHWPTSPDNPRPGSSGAYWATAPSPSAPAGGDAPDAKSVAQPRAYPTARRRAVLARRTAFAPAASRSAWWWSPPHDTPGNRRAAVPPAPGRPAFLRGTRRAPTAPHARRPARETSRGARADAADKPARGASATACAARSRAAGRATGRCREGAWEASAIDEGRAA